MKIKISELIDMFDEIGHFEYIVYDKKENNFIFIDLNMMSTQKYEETLQNIEEYEEKRYYFLPSQYEFYDSEIIEEYIARIENENIQEELENAFYGKGKYSRFRNIIRKFKLEDGYECFREKYLENMAIEWCEENKIKYEIS